MEGGRRAATPKAIPDAGGGGLQGETAPNKKPWDSLVGLSDSDPGAPPAESEALRTHLARPGGPGAVRTGRRACSRCRGG